jgi:membrane-bound lytic murein transglycosylase D
MQIRKAPLVEPVKIGIKYLALALPLIACSPSEQVTRPNQSSSDAAAAKSSFFGRLFSSPHINLPEAHMVTRETACVPYLGEDNQQANAVVPAAPGDLWQRMRDGMQLDHSVDDARVQKEIAYFSRNQRLLNRIAEQGSLYMYYVMDELEQRNMPLELALIPALESTYNPLARSPSGAIGMWQFMPGTARVYGLHVDNNFDERRDVVESTKAALNYLDRLNNKLGGGWLNAVAAYNTGELNIIAAMDRNTRQGKSTEFWKLQLRAPTSHYVPRLIALSKILANPSRYGIELMPIENAPVFSTIRMDSRFNLIQTASAAGISSQQLFALNPGINRNALPRGSYPLHVPIDRRDEFQRALVVSKPQPYVPTQIAGTGQRYVVQRGDNLGTIAKRFGMSVENLRAVNAIKGNAIRAGQSLIVSGTANAYAAADAAPAASKPAAAGPVKRGYTVKEGENLWRIARELNVSSRALAKWNGLTSNNLRTGQQLVVWTDAPEPASPHNAASGSKAVGYSVRSGDSLALIADRFDVSVDDIVRWNTLDRRNSLQPGQKLTLHVTR